LDAIKLFKDSGVECQDNSLVMQAWEVGTCFKW
jgi:hypothetical protein